MGNDLLNQWYWIIPNTVLFDNRLTDKQKLLFCLISSLCAEKWYCWASNTYLWEKLNVKAWTISNSVKALIDLWYIYSDVNKSKGNERHITIGNVINQNTYCEKSQYPYCEKSQDNNISNNNTNNKDLSPKPESVTPYVTWGDLTFEKIYNLFYHKSWHKPSIDKCKKVFDALNLDAEWYNMLVKDLNLFRIEYKYWIKDQMYRPWFEKYVWGFNAEWVNEEWRMKAIIRFHMDNRDDIEKMKKRYKDLCDTFWKEVIDTMVKEYWRTKNKITLNIN